MDERVGLGFEDGLAHGARVEQVERERLGSERPHTFAVSGRPEGADRLVASLYQLSNEPASDRAACPGDEDSHRVLLSRLVTSPVSRGSVGMTRRNGGT